MAKEILSLMGYTLDSFFESILGTSEEIAQSSNLIADEDPLPETPEIES